MSLSDLSAEHINRILDGTKIDWYTDRVAAWKAGERVAPVTIDMALTTTCNMGCIFCYRYLQHNKVYKITTDHMYAFLEDCAELDVKGISFVSDGESTISPAYIPSIERGYKLGLSMASGTNAYLLSGETLERVFPKLTYLRVNISAGTPEGFRTIMGVSDDKYFKQVCSNIREMVKLRREGKSNCTIGMQMVLMPQYASEVLPLAKLAIELEADYLVIKHCSDDEFGTLGVDYSAYEGISPILREAENLSTKKTLIRCKWSKINEGDRRPYTHCYGTPFLLQISGTGLVAPCGMLFNDRYQWAHSGNITLQRFKDIWSSDKYWDIVDHLAGRRVLPGMETFDARTMCGTLCLQHSVNKHLDQLVKGKVQNIPLGPTPPPHLAFV